MPSTPPHSLKDLLVQRRTSLDIACAVCGRTGSYVVASLIAERGADYPIASFLSEIVGGCPRRATVATTDCGAHLVAP